MLLPLGIAGLFCQVFAEEVAFRGYLQTQLAARFTSPVIWMSLPALGFGLLQALLAQEIGFYDATKTGDRLHV